MSAAISVKIVYSFCYLPARKMSNNSKQLKYTGIKTRRYALADQCTSDLAYKACAPLFSCSVLNTALSSPDLAVSSPDLTVSSPDLVGGSSLLSSPDLVGGSIATLIVATTSPDVPSPATASFLHKKLGLNNNVHCFDVASSCTSFLSALKAGAALIEPEKYALIVAAELKHKILDTQDERLVSLFSDGAGGFLLKNDSNSKFTFFYQNCDSKFADHISIPVGGSKQPTTIQNLKNNRLKMKSPKKMFLVTVEKLVEAIQLSVKSLNPQTNVLCFVHQANKNILTEVKKRLPDYISNKIPILMADIGNTLSASIPILRCRVYFLRSLFYYSKSKITKQNIIFLFEQACQNSDKFKYYQFDFGLVFKFEFNQEQFSIFDDNASCLQTSWLSDLDDEKLQDLNLIFESEFQNDHQSFEDIFIAAGGGFTTLGIKYTKYLV